MLAGFLGLSTPRTDALAARVARLADPGAMALISAGIVGVALARRRPRLGFTVIGVIVGANVTTQALKRLTAEPRTVASLAVQVAPESWPSGHATAAMAAALCLIAVSPGRLRAPAAVGGGGLALGVGYSVLLLGWHFPSDVLAGFCVAAVWTVSGFAVLTRVRKMTTLRLPWGWSGAVAAVLLVGGVLAADTLARDDTARLYAKPNAAFVFAALVIAVGACAPAVAVAALSRDAG